jgi:subfamily B ATP-binding cassette protein MsbA
MREEWVAYRRLFRYVYPYFPRLIVGALFGILFAGSTTGMLVALKGVMARIFSDRSLSIEAAMTVAALLPAFAILRGVGYFLSTYFIEWVGNRVVMDLRNQVFAHLQDLSALYFTRSRTGELISRATNDTSMVERAVSTVLSDLMREPFTLIGMIGFLVWLDWRLAIVSLVLFPICIVPVLLFGRRVRRATREGQEKLADLVSILQETLVGARIVKAFGMEDYEIGRFRAAARSVFNRIMRSAKARASVEPIIVFISMVGLALVFLYARMTHMTFDSFFAFGAALVALYDPVKKLGRVQLVIQQSSAAADRIFELLDAEITVKEKTGAVEFDGPVREIAFENVSFAYETSPVLSDLNVSISAGKLTAIVGGSGGGKSTLVGLLPRFYDVTSGAIRINGRDIRDFTLASLRRVIGLVTQETILFNDTVAANIAYGCADASRDRIQEAARRAHAHEFIMQLPDGYGAVIGERGLRLSGGQCQRLAIARAILRNPPILILDEATSALDTESERQVQAALDELMTGRTVFAIAHRLSTIMNADLILVLDKGSIVERGTHRELLNRGGLYKYLYDLQFQDIA